MKRCMTASCWSSFKFVLVQQSLLMFSVVILVVLLFSLDGHGVDGWGATSTKTMVVGLTTTMSKRKITKGSVRWNKEELHKQYLSVMYSSSLDRSSCDDPQKGTTTTTKATRRDVLLHSAGISLASLLTNGGSSTSSHPARAWAVNTIYSTTSSSSTSIANNLSSDNHRRTILITGANSGIGYEACKVLATEGHRLVLACRTKEKAMDTAKRLQTFLTTGGQQEAGRNGANILIDDDDNNNNKMIIPMECNLASLQSIDQFVNQLQTELFITHPKKKDDEPIMIDTICLNAGLARNVDASNIIRTMDGFELTIGVNHMGHFHLTNQLLLSSSSNNRPSALFNPVDGHIVVTASGVHDPQSPGGAQGYPAGLGNMDGLKKQGINCEMIDGSTFNADKAYKDSKLCNVLFTRELQRRLNANPNTQQICVNCFNPGLIVGTGLFRDQNPFFTKLFDVAATNVLKVGESSAWGGAALAYMTDVETKGSYYNSPPGTSAKFGTAAFGNQFTVGSISTEAQDDIKAKQLWDLTTQLLKEAQQANASRRPTI